jgi:hypothetical protein
MTNQAEQTHTFTAAKLPRPVMELHREVSLTTILAITKADRVHDTRITQLNQHKIDSFYNTIQVMGIQNSLVKAT